MTRAYSILLNLYPRDYKLHFAAEMLEAFEELGKEHRSQGRLAFARFVLTELTNLVRCATAEWTAKRTSNVSTRWRCLPDLMVMRPAGVSRDCWCEAASRMKGDR
jgi:hypothetical protein